MKKPNHIFLLTIFCALLFSCKKENKLNEKHMSQFVGDYEWTGTKFYHHNYGQPATSVVYVPDSASRYGLSIEKSGKIRGFKNGVETKTYSIESTSENNTSVTATFMIDGHEVNLVFNNDKLNCDFYPIYNGAVSYGSGHGKDPATNNFIKIDNTPSETTFAHYTPDCTAQLAYCGSYTGYELRRWFPAQPPAGQSDTMYYRPAKYYVAMANSFACKLVLQDSNQVFMYNFESSSSLRGCYIQDGKLNVYEGAQTQKFGPIHIVYSFKGEKDE